MGDEAFWRDLGFYAPRVMDIVSNLTKKSYIAVTNIETQKTWWSSSALQYFHLKENVHNVFGEKGIGTIHPDDKLLYKQGFIDRLEGRNLNKPLEYREKMPNGKYHLFTAMCDMLYKDNKPYLLITVIDNHGIGEEIDSLTGLHNEYSFAVALEQKMHSYRPFVAIEIGIMQMEHINVMYGIEYGNKVIRQVSEELLRIFINRGTVYRISNTKYGIILDNVGKTMIAFIYDSIVKTLAERLYVEGKKVPLKIAGSAIILDNYNGYSDSIISKLEYALNSSEKDHHGQLVLFNDYIGCSGNRELELMSIIHQCAIDNCKGFYMCYQPIVDAKTEKIKGMEALVRWCHEDYGTVPPGIFIEWLEEDPCIFDLGNWIIKQTLQDTVELNKLKKGFFVNINIAATQLERKEFRQSLLDMIKESGLETEQICLELTERCRKLDIAFLREEIEFFKSQGLRVALDDFGTGSASLSVASILPVDELKIDMSFIRDIQNKPENQAVVEAILCFAKKTGMETCIEGVEDAETVANLRQYEATYYQGYHYSKPVTYESLYQTLCENTEHSRLK